MATITAKGIEVTNCPHCGSPAELKTEAPGTLSPMFWVKCSHRECGASHLTKKTAEDAAATWNRRA